MVIKCLFGLTAFKIFRVLQLSLIGTFIRYQVSYPITIGVVAVGSTLSLVARWLLQFCLP